MAHLLLPVFRENRGGKSSVGICGILQHVCPSTFFLCLQVLNQLCLLWYSHGFAEVWGECATISINASYVSFCAHHQSIYQMFASIFLQVSIYTMQIIFGAVDIPAKFMALGTLSYLGRRVSQAGCLFMSALIIFANIFVPSGSTDLLTQAHMLMWPTKA